MQKIVLLMLLFWSIACAAFAQTFAPIEIDNLPMKLGEIDEKEVKATRIEQFPDADAVYLCDYGQARHETGANTRIVFEYVKRIKILKKTGLRHANQRITMYISGSSGEVASKIEGYTYNMEGGKLVRHELDKDAVSMKRISQDFRELKFVLPNVKEGSVIEFGYRVISDFWHFVPTWYFQSDIPSLWSEFRLRSAERFGFVELIQGIDKFHISEVTKENGYLKSRWALKNVAPLKIEPYVASMNNHLMAIHFQLSAINYTDGTQKKYLESWKKLIDDLLESERYGKYLNKGVPDKASFEKALEGKTTDKEKTIALYKYVRDNIKFGGRRGIYPKNSPKDVWSKKIGSASETNLLLVSLLREAGLQAYPVLLSTRGNGKIFMDYPILDKFNYNAVYVACGNEELLLDATNPMLSAGMLDERALNGWGLLIKPLKGDEKPNWVNLQAIKTKTSSISVATLAITSNGVIKGSINRTHNGYEAARLRKKFLQEVVDEEYEDDEETKEKVTDTQDFDKRKRALKHLKDYDKALEENYDIETNKFSQLNENFIYITPLLDYRLAENPFKSETRNFAIDYAYPMEQSFYLTMTLPEDYKVEELPKPLRIMWQDGSIKFDYLVANNGDKIQITSKFVLTRAIFKPEEYKMLRDLYAQIVAKQEEQIVLKKK